MIKENYKYETFEQNIYRILCFGFIALFMISVVLFFTAIKIEILKYRILLLKFSGISFLLFSLILLGFASYILIKNDVFEIGIEQAFYRAKVRYELEKSLIDAKIFFVRKGNFITDDTILVSLPKIKIDFLKNDIHGKIMIENSVNYQEKMEKIDISAAVKNYVQESVYLSDNRKYYIFLLSLDNSDIRLKFDSIEDMKLSPESKKNRLFIDLKTADLPYCHMLLSGQTGSGKTYAIFSLLLQLKLQNVPVVVIDPKNTNLSVFSEQLGYEAETETDEILRKIRSVVSDMKQRKAAVKKRIKETGKIDTTALDLGFKPQYLVIDEYAALQLRLDKKQQQEVASLIGEILLEGRSLGFHLILAMQQANAQLISTNLREQFQIQIVLGTSGLQTYNVVFGAHLASLIPSRQMRVGEGWAMISGRSVVPELISFPYLDFDLSKELRKMKSLKT